MFKKIGVILAVCLMFGMLVACGDGGGVDLTEINSKLNDLQDRVEDLEGQLDELEKQITVFYDWDNPIIVTSDELNAAYAEGFDVYMSRYGNKVVQVTGTTTGVSNSLNVLVKSIGSTYSIPCRFVTEQTFLSGQNLIIKGVVGEGFDRTSGAGIFGLFYCRKV